LITIFGVLVAIFGPVPLANSKLRLTGDPATLKANIIGQFCMWGFFGLILFVDFYLLQKLPSSIGFKSFSIYSVFWGVGLTAFNYCFSRVWIPLMPKLGLGTFDVGISNLQTFPIWYLVFAVITAGIVEETLYRGFLIEQTCKPSQLAGQGSLQTPIACARMAKNGRRC
jgi:membrane protease YdiL (CAAX protease family)